MQIFRGILGLVPVFIMKFSEVTLILVAVRKFLTATSLELKLIRDTLPLTEANQQHFRTRSCFYLSQEKITSLTETTKVIRI